MIEIVRASPAHVGVIANRMRQIDRDECAAFGHSPKTALRNGLRASTEAWTAKVDGVPACMFGLVPVSILEGEATPWFLGSDETYRHPRDMIVTGEALVSYWLESWRHLSNYVAVENVKAIRLLERWGFSIGEEREFGGAAFVRFEAKA